MKILELRKKTDKDLIKLLNEKREALSKFRFGVSGAKVTNVKEGYNLRKTIARIETLLREMKKQANVMGK